MTWGFSSYETRFRWIAALWAILMTVWCMSPLPWEVRLIGGGVWVAVTVLASACFAWWRPRSAREIPIFLSMEGVSEEISGVSRPERVLRPSELEALIRNLLSAGYRFQTVREALIAPVRKSVVLVVDGGTRDGLSVLLPLLRRLRVKATCFVACHEAGDPRFLKSLELQEMGRSGWVEFGGTLGGGCRLPRRWARPWRAIAIGSPGFWGCCPMPLPILRVWCLRTRPFAMRFGKRVTTRRSLPRTRRIRRSAIPSPSPVATSPAVCARGRPIFSPPAVAGAPFEKIRLFGVLRRPLSAVAFFFVGQEWTQKASAKRGRKMVGCAGLEPATPTV